ncbi:nitrile hydratase subunit alpha [Actinomadura sp. HBU206391]|uniref:nitrile hydratase subunit alpha n=1 Tax=Actinomadura sp. HBU206391 TaxID=2731692 RepID=UPI0016503FF2|nr:nitrile hydratase subunit alpha [Actinomadura sp. HBU206391]MBC6460611.1 nitrile hydratase subunit alpha [Actinomadura sp. HBU206391]
MTGHGHEDLPVAARVRRLEERVIAAGLTDDEALDAILTRLFDTATPVNGARIVARAWTDEAFRERLLTDGSAGAAELGFPTLGIGGGGYRLRVVANTPDRHNMIVCTLCSCYPISLLGPSPSWYKSLAYRSRAVREPRAVLAEFGLTLPDDVEISVWDTSAETRYLVLPRRPDGTGDLPADDLAALVTRNGLIGTAAV